MAQRQNSAIAAEASSNYFIRVTLLTLAGKKETRTFRVVLLKGVQIVASTKFPWRMENGVLDFELTNLDFPLLSYNVKRSSNAELSVVLYELQENDHSAEDEIGYVNISIADLVNAFVDKGTTKHERKDAIAPYKLQYWIKVDRTRPEKFNQQYPQQAVTHKADAPKDGAVQAAPASGDIAAEEKAEPEQTGKIRQIGEEELNKAEISVEQPHPPAVVNNSQNLSLLDVTDEGADKAEKATEQLPEIIQPISEGNSPEEGKKIDVKLKHTVSMDADKIVKNLEEGANTPGPKPLKLQPNNRNLLIAILVVAVLIYFLFLRGSKPKSEVNKPAKPGKSSKEAKESKPKKPKKK